jgi:hypothetical protein
LADVGRWLLVGRYSDGRWSFGGWLIGDFRVGRTAAATGGYDGCGQAK